MLSIKLYRCGNEQSISEHPLGLGYLLTNCHNADIQIVKNPKQIVNCDIIGLSGDASGTKEAIDILNKANVPVIIGGPIVLWEGIKDYPFKHIILGDGELALQSIIDGNKDRFIHMPVENLDTLAFPNRGACNTVVPMLTSRGCPFSCRFCSSRAFWGKPRFHSADYFISETLDILKTYPNVKELYILDDLFIGNKRRFAEIYEQWMTLGLNKKLTLRSFVRSNILTVEIAKQMKEMGFKRIRFGAESGSDRVLKMLNKGATVQDHQRAIDIAQQVGLPISASFMHHLPGETEEELQMTKAFIAKNKGKLIVEGYYLYKPFPGTVLYNNESPLTDNMRVR